MYLFESIFDIMYLSIVISLGIKLLLQESKNAKLFGLMACILGFGDAFHLIPRIVSMWSSGGFEANIIALSYGKLITSISMTIFYLIYYIYLKKETNFANKFLDITIYFLVLSRIILTLLPYNNWGEANPSYAWSIIRNIPFLVFGIILIILSYKFKNKKPFENMHILISLSFLFYIPVVLFSPFYKAFGAFMMPKTIAYLFIVYYGFKHYINKFDAINILENSFVMLVMGLISGVFYREFTKIYNYTGKTSLAVTHTHLIIGSLISILIFIFIKNNKDTIKSFKKTMMILNTGLLLTITMMIIRGITQVLNSELSKAHDASISGIAGIGHFLFGLLLVCILYRVIKILRRKWSNHAT